MTHRTQLLRKLCVLLLVLGVFPALVLGTLNWFMRSARKRAAADPAIYAAQSSPAIIALLGSPIAWGWPIRGQASSSNGSGSADLQIPLSGTLGKGVLIEHARQQAKQWLVCALEFHSATGLVVPMVNGSHSPCAAK